MRVQPPSKAETHFYELSHQLLQMQDLSNPSRGLKLNWTVASAGSVFNAIPEDARAIGDMRADDAADFAGLEPSIREKIRKHFVPDTSVDVRFERLYPPMSLRQQSLPIAEYAQRIYSEYGGKLSVATKSPGAGTDAAFAALKTDAPILEGMGLRMYGAHSNEDEYIVISSIEPAYICQPASSSTFPWDERLQNKHRRLTKRHEDQRLFRSRSKRGYLDLRPSRRQYVECWRRSAWARPSSELPVIRPWGCPRLIVLVGNPPRKATCPRPCRVEVKSCRIPATSTTIQRPNGLLLDLLVDHSNLPISREFRGRCCVFPRIDTGAFAIPAMLARFC